MDENRQLTVYALTKYIKRKFDADPHLKNVAVKGELSNVKHHSSGHVYFTLKDDRSRMMAVMFSNAARSLPFRPENGMEVVLTADVTVYEASGQYQLYVKTMQQGGTGNLFLAFEQLKKKLEREGLFRSDMKKPIPPFPQCVAVVTSPTGAAIRDILTTIHRRFPSVDVLVYPALVQGERAAASVAGQIERINKEGRADVIIAGRGGGSIEELWAFNEEVVARAIHASRLPVISAVGHETDFTIADFAADLRAPTPTAAAELAVPHIEEVTERIRSKESRLTRALAERVRSARSRHQAAVNAYVLRNPDALYRQHMQRLDRLDEQLAGNAAAMLEKKAAAADYMKQRLSRSGPSHKIKVGQGAVLMEQARLQRAAAAFFTKKQTAFSQKAALLDALSPLKVMDRGYSLTYKENKLVKQTNQVQPGDRIHITLSDGTIQATVQSVEGEKS